MIDDIYTKGRPNSALVLFFVHAIMGSVFHGGAAAHRPALAGKWGECRLQGWQGHTSFAINSIHEGKKKSTAISGFWSGQRVRTQVELDLDLLQHCCKDNRILETMIFATIEKIAKSMKLISLFEKLFRDQYNSF